MRRPAFCNLLLLAALFLFAFLPPNHAVADESRVALVIGQSAYRAVPPLPNAANDAKHMAELLISAGFAVGGTMPELTAALSWITLLNCLASVSAS